MRLLARVLRELGVSGPVGSRRGRLSRHPRLPGPGAERGHRSARRRRSLRSSRACSCARARPSRADPRERALVRACAPAAAGVHAAGCDRGRGEPAGRTGGDARAAGDARRLLRRAAGVLRRRLGRLPRPDRPAERVGARRRPQHRVPGRRRPRHRDERSDLGLQRRARAGHDHRRADRRDAPPVRPHGRRAAGRVRRTPPRRTCADVDRAVLATSRPTTCCRTGGSTSATGSGCATTRRRSSTSATTRCVEPGMVFTIEPGLYSAEVGGFRHSDTVVVTDDGIDVLTSYPRTSRA